MFSTQPRCRYRLPQLGEVICQLRFPEILSVSAKDPADFQDAIRADFPQFSRREEVPAPKLVGSPGNLTLQKAPSITNYQFSSADGVWRVNLTSKFISLTCTDYTGWESFAARLDKPLAAFIRLYQPAYFERVGLRYLNFISRKALSLEGCPFRDLIAPQYLGPLALETVCETSASHCSVDLELAIAGGCRAKLHAGPGLVKRGNVEDKEVKFIFDQDLYMPGQLPLNLSTAALQTLHSQADAIFRGAITETLHDAMEPTIL